MGLAEHIKKGAKLARETIELQTDGIRSGSVNLGSAYALLSINTTIPCRLRLYEDQTSLNVFGEISRSFINTGVSEAIALIGDFSMSAAGTYTIDPVLYGVVKNPSTKLTYYRIDQAPSGQFPKIMFNRYLLEDSTVGTENRINIPTISHTLATGSHVINILEGTNIPRSYILVSASATTANTVSRIRLYSTSESLYNPTEISRSFATESLANTKLIVDAMISGSSTTQFVPKIVGANLKTMGTNLNAIRNSTPKIMGENELYYILQNVTSSTPTANINVSLHVFSLED